MDVSIVIISRNEARNIGRTLKAAFGITTKYQYEVLLIDSNSEDETLNIARSFEDLRCYRLDKIWPHTAAMGRYTGTLKATGDYIVFMDGDMEINPTWVDKGIGFLKEHPDISVVSGKIREIRKDRADNIIEVVNNREINKGRFGGSFIISRIDLIAVNNFDYRLKVHEEVDLYYRLTEIGKKHVKIPEEMCIHHTLHPMIFAEISRRFKNGYYQGYGLFVRKYLFSGKLDIIMKEMGFCLSFGAFQIITIMVLLYPNWVLIALIGFIWLIFLIYKIRTQKRVRNLLFNLLIWECIFIGIIVGINKPLAKNLVEVNTLGEE